MCQETLSRKKTETERMDERISILGTQDRMDYFEEANFQSIQQQYQDMGYRLSVRSRGKRREKEPPAGPVTMQPVQVEPVTEPPMGRKAQKAKNKALKESRKQKAKIGAHASNYTDYIMKSDQIKVWEDDPEPLPPTVEEMKRVMFAKKFDANMFQKDFFGRNYLLVRGEIDK